MYHIEVRLERSRRNLVFSLYSPNFFKFLFETLKINSTRNVTFNLKIKNLLLENDSDRPPLNRFMDKK